MNVLMYTDGSARENPNGPGGYGVIIRYPKHGKMVEKEISAGYRLTTNNRMELMGVIVGLSSLDKPCNVEIDTNSKYIVESINKGWLKRWAACGWKKADGNPVKNVDLWERLLALMERHKVSFCWVKGHDGDPLNERCDAMATAAADGKDLLIDVEYEKIRG